MFFNRQKNTQLRTIMSSSIERTILAKKLLCQCPICQKKIYGGTLDLNNIDVSKIKHFPFSYTYIHSEPNALKHAITLYFDANLTLRGVEESNLMKME